MSHLIYILLGWGITDILVNGSILDGTRNYFLVKLPFFGKLFTCIQCSGFWVGVLLGLASCFTLRSSPFEQMPAFVEILSSGFLISGSCVIINALVFSLLSGRQKNKSED